MRLTLYNNDLKAEFKSLSVDQIEVSHFNERAQMALKLIGGAFFSHHHNRGNEVSKFISLEHS